MQRYSLLPLFMIMVYVKRGVFILFHIIKKIHLKDSDELIMVGDYIDRGDQNVEMMKWLEDHPENIIPVRGNHDENYAAYIGLMDQVDRMYELDADPASNKDACKLYELTFGTLLKTDPVSARYFDMYGTIRRILLEDQVTMGDLRRWAKMFRSFPAYR